LHGLRIECKKLRYLLDCAAQSVGSTASAQCVGVLRGLQEVLGVVNDARLQVERLEGWARPLARREPQALLALGRWIERRHAVERRARTRFAERFEGFGARGARKGFEVLDSALRAGAGAP
jgi:CHAD domain-containing protein